MNVSSVFCGVAIVCLAVAARYLYSRDDSPPPETSSSGTEELTEQTRGEHAELNPEVAAKAQAAPPNDKERSEGVVSPTAVDGPLAAWSTALAWLRGLDAARFGSFTESAPASLRELNLRGLAVTDADLGHLLALPELHSLNLRGTAVTDAGLYQLTQLPKLEGLELRDTRVSALGLRNLPGNLRHLDLTSTRAGVGCCAALPALVKLETLKLNGLPIMDDGILALPALPKLRHVELDRTRVTFQGLEQLLLRYPTLERIELRGLKLSDEQVTRLSIRYPQVVVVTD